MTHEPREPDPKGSPGDEEEPLVAHLARLSGHGLTIALATGIFLMAGWWVDGKLGTAPLLTVLGAMLGAAAGFYSMLQHLLFFPREKKRREEQDEKTKRDTEGR